MNIDYDNYMYIAEWYTLEAWENFNYNIGLFTSVDKAIEYIKQKFLVVSIDENTNTSEHPCHYDASVTVYEKDSKFSEADQTYIYVETYEDEDGTIQAEEMRDYGGYITISKINLLG